MSLWHFAGWIEPVPAEARITLGEGLTPLIPSRRLGLRLGLQHLFFKLEYVSPTGSYKDRFAAVAISHMVAQGKRLCVATSSGNTGASLAAYCACAGLQCVLALVETAPAEKLQQMLAYGATLHRVRGFGIDPDITQRVFDAVQSRGARADAATQISAYRYSPAGMSGVETIGYELAEQLRVPIDHVFCPAGGGGLVLAVARAFSRLVEHGHVERAPAVECVQPVGNDTISTPLKTGERLARAVECTTKISGLQVPSVIDGNEVIEACRACGGGGHGVTDKEVWNVQALLAREEGIFTEPAGAVSVAGALRAAACGEIPLDAIVVCLVTASGFKDRPAVERMVRNKAVKLIDVTQFADELDKATSAD
jgi:threonine synthase